MRFRWEKRGVVVPAPPPVTWAASHAAVPTVDVRADGTLRLFFSARDGLGRSHIGLAEGTLGGELRYRAEAVLAPGALGTFDDNGVTIGSIVRDGDRHLLYYNGWTRGVSVPFYTFIGCAVSDDDCATFRRVSPAPIVDRDAHDPYLTTTPWVLREGDRWRMWYTAGTAWRPHGDGVRHWYHIRYAESSDGIAWERDGTVCIDYRDESEYAISRPCVVKDAECYRMWFSYRGDTYRIGYAESSDGVRWTRLDTDAGIDVSGDGWDSQMVEYPLVFDLGGSRWMLYNGNDYGRTGIGLARLASPRDGGAQG